LIVVYGYCLLIGANFLSDGSELLLEILDPGIIGGELGGISELLHSLGLRRLYMLLVWFPGLVLPILGSLPDSLVIIVSGLGAATREEAQEQVRSVPCTARVLSAPVLRPPDVSPSGPATQNHTSSTGTVFSKKNLE
jgi:hypothetical protein